MNKNTCDINSKPGEKYQTVKRKSVNKGDEKLRAEISCKNRYETLYLTNSQDANITEDTGNRSSTNDEFCFDKKKRNEREERTYAKKEISSTCSIPQTP